MKGKRDFAFPIVGSVLETLRKIQLAVVSGGEGAYGGGGAVVSGEPSVPG